MNKTIQAILNDAVDGPAIAYWARASAIILTDGKVEAFRVRDGDPDGTGKVKKGSKLINERTITDARNKVVNGDVKVRRDLAAQFVGKPEDWQYDSEGVDVLIQVAFFGELAYG